MRRRRQARLLAAVLAVAVLGGGCRLLLPDVEGMPGGASPDEPEPVATGAVGDPTPPAPGLESVPIGRPSEAPWLSPTLEIPPPID